MLCETKTDQVITTSVNGYDFERMGTNWEGFYVVHAGLEIGDDMLWELIRAKNTIRF